MNNHDSENALQKYRELSEKWLDGLARSGPPRLRGGTMKKSKHLESLREALVGMQELARNMDYSWRLLAMVDYQKILISEGALLYALVTLVNDVKPDLHTVVHASKSPNSVINTYQIRSLAAKMSTSVQFADNVLSVCLKQESDIRDQAFSVLIMNLRQDSERKKQGMRNIIHWLNAFTLGLGVAALATLAASAKQASKYFVAYAILCYSIGALAGGYEDARGWRAHDQERLLKNLQKIKKNDTLGSVKEALNIARELEGNGDETWQGWQSLLQEIQDWEQLFKQWDLIPKTTVVTTGGQGEVTPEASQ